MYMYIGSNGLNDLTERDGTERNGQNGMEKITRFSVAKRNGTGTETGLFF